MKKLFLILIISLFLFGCNSYSSNEQEENILFEQNINLFIAIHNEPGNSPSSTTYQEEHWPALVALVNSADKHNLKLNLLFNPQWATYILEDASRSSLVRQWSLNGHEIGLHYHTLNASVVWNGYTDDESYINDIRYQGNVEDMMDLLKQLPFDNEIRTAAVSDAYSDYDYPSEIIYDVDGGWDPTNDLISSPTMVEWNDNTKVQLRHARYSGIIPVNINVGLEGIENAIAMVQPNEAIGIVFHTFEYYDDPVPFDALFSYLEDEGIQSKTVTEIMHSFGY